MAAVTIANSGSTAVSGWTLAFTFPGDQKITNAWSGTVTQTGAAVSITNASYNGAIPPGGSTTIGFERRFNAAAASSEAFQAGPGNPGSGGGTPCNFLLPPCGGHLRAAR